MSAGDVFRAQAAERQAQLDAMAEAHAEGHDPCDCLGQDDLDIVLEFIERRLELADAADAAALAPKPVKRGVELLDSLYGKRVHNRQRENDLRR